MDSFADYVSLGALVATAAATLVLGWFTRVLAKETRRLVESSSQPHVVASIEQNIWSFIHADLRVDNTGNATAYDIDITFDPPLSRHERDETLPAPFRKVSVLRPNGSLRSFLGEFQSVGKEAYMVKVSWKRDPNSSERESYAYTLSMSDFDGITQLGDASPFTQIAREMKHIREDWKPVASGSHRLKVDQFTSSDRNEERERVERAREEHRRKQT